jgi:hypothetical protein
MGNGLVMTLPLPPGTTGGGGGEGEDEVDPGLSARIAVYGSGGKLVDGGATIADVIAIASQIPPTPVAQNSFLVSGGAIVWISAYNFTIAAATYYINGILIHSIQQNVSLAAADASLDRIDVIAVNAAAAVVVVAGTAAAQPAEPDVDPATQLKLGVILVSAATSAPVGASVTNLWLEQAGSPTEWDWTASGSGFTIGSTSNPRTGTKCLEGTAVPKNSYLQAAMASGGIDPNDYDSLVLYIKSKASWTGNRALKFQWHASGAAKGLGLNLASGVYGFDSAQLSAYQMVVIPMVQFAVPQGTACNQLRITDTNGAIGFFIDDISLQQGIPSDLQIDALTQAQADARYVQLPHVRKVGVSLDGTTGVKGSVQVDFAGTIIGWSVQADVAGDLFVEVSKVAGTQAVPVVPDPTTHKISASAPITLAAAQAAGVGEAGVATWNRNVAQWDSIQFKVVTVTTVTRAVLWLRIREA